MNGAREFVAALAILLLTGCGSNTVVRDYYYSLVLAANDVEIKGNDDATTARLIVGPVQLPAYLGRRGLPMQVGPNRIESAHHHFWAEPLDEAIAKVLVRDIAALAVGIDVERDSGRLKRRGDCRVRLEFDAFHPTSDSRVVTSGRYWISSGDESRRHEFSLTRALRQDGFAHAVDELRAMLRTLAEQMSDDLKRPVACTAAARPKVAAES